MNNNDKKILINHKNIRKAMNNKENKKRGKQESTINNNETRQEEKNTRPEECEMITMRTDFENSALLLFFVLGVVSKNTNFAKFECW